jgi:ABC-type spermidine/putrescine transport system permease subunit I
MTGFIERFAPWRWTASVLRRLGLRGRVLVVAVPFLWLLVFFLVPFLVVAKISLSEPAIAMPPYLPLMEWDGVQALLTLNFGNFLYLFDDPLYLNAYIFSIRIAFISAVIALFVGYPMAYYIARSPEPRRSLLLTLVILPFWTSVRVSTSLAAVTMTTSVALFSVRRRRSSARPLPSGNWMSSSSRSGRMTSTRSAAS